MTHDCGAPLDPASPTQLLALFRRYGFRPRRRFGQSFLVDANIVRKIVGAAGLTGEERVVELGAGAGAVTRALCVSARRVVAVEIDPVLVAMLRETVGEGAEVVRADMLKLRWPDLLGGEPDQRWRLVANLPYSITGPAIVHVLDGLDWFDVMVIMVQQEVAERLLAPPGTRTRGLLTVLLEAGCEISLAGRVRRTCFLPRPRVDSALLRLEVRRRKLVPSTLEHLFRRLVKAAFQSRRKTLPNVLSGAESLGLSKQDVIGLMSDCDIGTRQRAEDLTTPEFIRLAAALAERTAKDTA